MVVHGVDVYRGVIEIGRGRGDKFGAGGTEEFFEEGERLGPAALKFHELVAVFFAQGRVNGIVELGGVEGNADGDEGVHLVVFLGDAIVLGVLLEVLGPGDVHEDVGEHANGVGVAAHHHVAESYVVVCGEVRGHYAGEHGFLVELDVIECFEGETKVPEEAVDS